MIWLHSEKNKSKVLREWLSIEEDNMNFLAQDCGDKPRWESQRHFLAQTEINASGIRGWSTEQLKKHEVLPSFTLRQRGSLISVQSNFYICPARDKVETRPDESFRAFQKKQENNITTLEVIFTPFNLEKGIMLEIALYDF